MPKRNLAWILVIGMITLLMWQLPQTIAGRDAVYTAFGPLVDARAQIRKRFVNEVDDNELVAAAVDAGIRAMVAKLNDPYAVYFNQSEFDRFRTRTEGVFGGVGIDVYAVPQGLEVLSRAPNSPAIAAHIMPGDIITHIEGKAANTITLVEAVNNMLNGPRDTEVSLTVIRPNEKPPVPRVVKLVRTEIHLDPVRGWSRSPTGGWRYMLDPTLHIGYIRLTKFTPDIAERMDQEVEQLLRSNMGGLVLDLRENTGGLLDSARQVSDRFLDTGLIVRTSGRRADGKEWMAMHDGTYPNFPVVVLINGTTASAAEIVAGALRDHQRAVVVGERSYGKGSVQEVVELDRHSGAIKLTTAYYYLPNGQCIHRTAKANQAGNWGVAPNVNVPLTREQREAWFAAWRDIGREVVAPTTSSAPTSSPAEQADEATAVQKARLLTADPQLAKAVELLGAILRPPATSAPAQPQRSS